MDTLATIKAMDLMTEEDFQEMRCLLEHGEQLNREDDVDGVLKTFRLQCVYLRKVKCCG